MAQWQWGNKEEARKWNDKAVDAAQSERAVRAGAGAEYVTVGPDAVSHNRPGCRHGSISNVISRFSLVCVHVPVNNISVDPHHAIGIYNRNLVPCASAE
jgi:hypothetical protein